MRYLTPACALFLVRIGFEYCLFFSRFNDFGIILIEIYNLQKSLYELTPAN
jgi:hypothetical protein